MVVTTLRAALAERVVVADGPDILAGIHEAYLEAGAECLGTIRD
jgi:methionine synthase I (cobalamin-dependent)